MCILQKLRFLQDCRDAPPYLLPYVIEKSALCAAPRASSPSIDCHANSLLVFTGFLLLTDKPGILPSELMDVGWRNRVVGRMYKQTDSKKVGSIGRPFPKCFR